MENIINKIRELPFYDKLSEPDKEELAVNAYVKQYKAGDILHDHHAECLGMVLVISGEARVTMQSDDGREITIYKIEAGDVDVLSASCVINQITFDTMMVADTEMAVIVIPAMTVSKLQQENIYLHSYIYEVAVSRFSDAMWTMQQILFLKMDQRVANGLLDEYARTDDTHLRITQDKLAKNISSAREVVSRVLKRFEDDGYIKLGRGQIELTDTDGLYKLL